MKRTFAIIAAIASAITFASCGETTQKDNTTHDSDTMVIKQDKTDSATNSVSTDTTKR